MKTILLTGLGGGIGAMLRLLTGWAIPATGFPLATLLINITGSFLLGVIWAMFPDGQGNNGWRNFLGAGLCGGFTTFSAFSMENMQLLQDGKFLQSFSYILVSVMVGLFAAWIGFKWLS